MKEITPRDILASNLRKMIKAESRSVRAWALSRGLDVRMVDRMTKGTHAVTLDKIDEVADACGLQAWHLLLPDLEPGEHIDAPISSEDSELLDKLKRLLR